MSALLSVHGHASYRAPVDRPHTPNTHSTLQPRACSPTGTILVPLPGPAPHKLAHDQRAGTTHHEAFNLKVARAHKLTGNTRRAPGMSNTKDAHLRDNSGT